MVATRLPVPLFPADNSTRGRRRGWLEDEESPIIRSSSKETENGKGWCRGDDFFGCILIPLFSPFFLPIDGTRDKFRSTEVRVHLDAACRFRCARGTRWVRGGSSGCKEDETPDTRSQRSRLQRGFGGRVFFRVARNARCSLNQLKETRMKGAGWLGLIMSGVTRAADVLWGMKEFF